MSAQLAAFGIVVAAFVTKRAFALVSVLGGLLVMWIATEIVVNLTDAGAGSVPVVMLSPLHVARGATLVLFGAVPEFRSFDETGGDMTVGALDLPGIVWIVAIIVHIAIFSGLAIRRYRTSV